MRSVLILLATGATGAACRPAPEPPTTTGSETGTRPPDTATWSPSPTGDTATTGPTSTGTFDAPFLWAPLVLEGAPDLGHVPAPVEGPVEPGPVVLTEVGAAAGLGGSHTGGGNHGVGIAFVDADGDGWDDLLLVNGVSPSGTTRWPTELWRNRGDGTFEDVSAPSGIAAALGERDGMSVAAGDLDRDGRIDLYVGAHPADVLLLGGAEGTFSDGTAAASAGGPVSMTERMAAKIVGVGDYDADGLLDVVSASDSFVDPGPGGYVLHGVDGGFEDTTAATGFTTPSEGTPCAVMWADHDADGRADLVIWHDMGDPLTNRALLASDGAGFTDRAVEAGWTNPLSAPMGIDAADVDRDGWLDFFVGNGGPNLLLLSNGDGTWLDWAQAAGITEPTYSWGLGFEDLDRDGWWDLFVGHPDEHYVLRHERTDPPTFSTATVPHPLQFPGNQPVAFADYDRDGDVDVAAGGVGGMRVELHRNDTDRGTTRSLEVRVGAAPGDGAAGGVGARVVVSAGGVVLWRDITGGSSRASQNALSARFGLGQVTGADWVGVLWPDGRQLVVRGVPGDVRLVVRGEAVEVEPLTAR